MAATYVLLLRELEQERKALQDKAMHEPDPVLRAHQHGQAWANQCIQLKIREAFDPARTFDSEWINAGYPDHITH